MYRHYFATSMGILTKFPRSHIRKLTAEHNSPMPVVDTAHQHLLTARALHLERTRAGDSTFPVLDWSALVSGTRAAAGLDALDSSKASIS